MKNLSMVFKQVFTAILACGCISPALSQTTTQTVAQEDRFIPPALAPGEQFDIIEPEEGVRVGIHKYADAGTPSRLIFYLLPNGNTIEETFGRSPQDDLPRRYAIQQIGAQTRRLWQLSGDKSVMVLYLENQFRAWPEWRRKTPDANAKIRDLTNDLRKKYGPDADVSLVAHSGGGSYIIGILDSGNAVPDYIDRISYLDANYSFDAETSHGVKLLNWLREDVARRLSVVAYDDRDVVLNGKKIVSDTGGTWRATDRMARDFERLGYNFAEMTSPESTVTSAALAGRIKLIRIENPDLKILHTVLVERNGYLWSMLDGSGVKWEAGDEFWTETPRYFELREPK